MITFANECNINVNLCIWIFVNFEQLQFMGGLCVYEYIYVHTDKKFHCVQIFFTKSVFSKDSRSP